MNQSTSFSESEAASKLADATKKLMEALPRSSQSLLSDFKFNDDESVQMTATQLVEFMDSLNRVRKYKLDHERAKGIVRTLFTAVYPFLKASLQAGSLVVQVIAFTVSQRKSEIGKVLDTLRGSLHRLRLLQEIPHDILSRETARSAALDLCSAVCFYLTAAIKILKHSALTNVVLFRDSSDFTNKFADIKSAITAYNASIGDVVAEVGIRTREDVTALRVQGAQILEMTTRIETQLSEKEKTSFDEWLSASAVVNRDERERLWDFQESSSPAWVFSLPEVQTWLIDPGISSNILWLTATTGLGKSVISAYLSKELAIQFPSTAVTYFFCREKAKMQTVQELVLTLLSQICDVSKAANEKIQRIWKEKPRLRDALDVRSLHDELLLPALESLDRQTTEHVFILVDGMNELPDDTIQSMLQFLHLLESLHRRLGIPTTRILLTSQVVSTKRNELDKVPRVPLTSTHIEDSVITFVRTKMSRDLQNKFWQINLDPVEWFRTRHGLMFIWVAVVIEYLEEMVFEDVDFKQVLATASTSVKRIYEAKLIRLTEELNELQLSWVKEIFRWVVVSKRNLTLSELACGVRASRQKVHSGELVEARGVRSILNKCGALIQVVKKGRSREQSVTLLHDTFKDFITIPHPEASPHVQRFLIQSTESEHLLANICLSYLMKQNVDFPENFFINDDRLQRHRDEHPLFAYASQYWSKHVTAVQLDATTSLARNVLQNLRQFLDRKTLKRWICNVMADAENRLQAPLNDHVACSVGLSLNETCKWIEKNQDNAHCFQILQNDSKGLVQQSAGAAVDAWLAIDPYYWTSSLRCFDMAVELVFDREYVVNSEQDVVRLLGLAMEASRNDRYKWFGNQAVAYLCYSTFIGSASDLAERCLKRAIGSKVRKQNIRTLHRLADCLSSRAKADGSFHDADMAVMYEEQAIAGLDPNDLDYPGYLNMLASCLLQRAKLRKSKDDQATDSAMAVKICKEAVQLSLAHGQGFSASQDGDQRDRKQTLAKLSGDMPKQDYSGGMPSTSFNSVIFNSLDNMSLALDQKLIGAEDLLELITTCKFALTQMDEPSYNFWVQLTNATFAYCRSLPPSSNDKPGQGEKARNELLNDIISDGRKVLGVIPDQRFIQLYAHNIFANTLMLRKRTGDLDESIEHYRFAISQDREDDPVLLSNLATALFTRNKDPTDIKDGLATLRKGFQVAMHRKSEVAALYANKLASALVTHGDGADKDEALHFYEIAYDLTPEDKENFCTYAHDFAYALYSRGGENDLDTALACYRRVMKFTLKTDVAYTRRSVNLSQLLKNHGKPDDLAEAIDRLRECIRHTDTGHAVMPECQKLLGDILLEVNATKHQDEIIELYRAAATLAEKLESVDISTLATYLNNLGEVLEKRGLERDHGEAIDLFRTAINLVADDNVNKAWYANNLGNALYDRDASEKDRRDTLEAFRTATRLSGEEYMYFYVYAASLGQVLVVWKIPGGRQEAVDVLRKVVALAPEGWDDLADRLSDLVTALIFYDIPSSSKQVDLTWLPLQSISRSSRPRIEQLTAGVFNADRSLDDIGEAIVYMQKFTELKGNDPLGYVVLSQLLLLKFAQTEAQNDLMEAAKRAEAAIEIAKVEAKWDCVARGLLLMGLSNLRGRSKCHSNLWRWLPISIDMAEILRIEAEEVWETIELLQNMVTSVLD